VAAMPRFVPICFCYACEVQPAALGKGSLRLWKYLPIFGVEKENDPLLHFRCQVEMNPIEVVFASRAGAAVAWNIRCILTHTAADSTFLASAANPLFQTDRIYR